ncbi:hypothetical protein [Vreelandella massiliensis]|uniref:hypothetical protein n=1 Tax=Vreelandella massiliensis TaxID=1816686 RepID=UPI00118185FF|nr:hypothetical protein [Halomonas massiliensis]
MSLEIMVAGIGGIQVEYSEYTRIVSGSGTLQPPTGAKAMRVAAIGAGGGAASILNRALSDNSDWETSACGGGGGGCAATKIVKAEPVTYSIGLGGVSEKDYAEQYNLFVAASGNDGGDTTATFGSYSLVGTGGEGGHASNVGVELSWSSSVSGQGGDYSFTGGRARLVRSIGHGSYVIA